MNTEQHTRRCQKQRLITSRRRGGLNMDNYLRKLAFLLYIALLLTTGN
jgi:hypothetical protein